MARFDTEDFDFSSEDNFYDPENHFDVNNLKKTKKKHFLFFDNLKNFKNFSSYQIIYVCFAIILIFILLNLNLILDWMFYMTLYILQYVLVILLFIAIGYYIWKKLF